MTITLDPTGAQAWLAQELGDLFPSSVTFTPVPGSPDTFRQDASGPTQLFWGSSDVMLEMDGNIANPSGYRFFRTINTTGELNTVPIRSVTETLSFSVVYEFDAKGGVDPTTASVSRRLRTFGAALDLGRRMLAIELTPIGDDQFELHAWFPEGQGPSLGDVFLLLGYASGAESDIRSDLAWLPDELRTGSLVEITDLHAMLQHGSAGKEETVALPGQRTGGCTIQNIAVGLRFLDGHSWNLIPGYDVLKAGDLTARLSVDYPLDSDYRFPRIDVGGVVTIHTDSHPDAHIDLQARWPDYSLSGRLRSGEELPLGAVLEQFGVPSGKLPDGGDSLIISDFVLEAEPVFTPRSFSLLLTVRNVWKFALGSGKTLDIERISVYVDYRGGKEGSVSGRLSAQLAVAGVGCLLSAEASNGGWEFQGSLFPADGTSLQAGLWIQNLAQQLGVQAPNIPGTIAAFAISLVEVSLNTATRDMSFRLNCTTKLNGKDDLDAELTLHYSEQADRTAQFEITGSVTAGSRRFDLVFNKDASDTRLLAVYANANKDVFDLGEALAQLSGLPVPSLPISLSSIEVALDKAATGTTVLAGVDIGGTINLAQLPLVGSLLRGDQAVSMSLQALYCSAPKAAATPGLLSALQNLLPNGSLPLPAAAKIETFNLTPTLQVGKDRYELSLPVSIDSQGTVGQRAGAAPSSVSPSSGSKAVDAGGVSWFGIQKQLGPVYISRIGGRYRDGEAAFLIDATLALGPLTFSLDGLSVSTPLAPKNLPFSLEPTFSLNGLGLGLAAGPVSISGSFLHDPVSGDYSGTAALAFKDVKLSAIGSYTEVGGQKSLFLYAILDYPLGGPSFFFVEGIAAGFGYNRAFLAPPISQVHEFPLIVEAKKGRGLPKNVGEEIQKLREFIPATVDQYFLAAGIKFNSFKLIDSVAIVAVSLGLHFEVAVLGNSQLVLPTPESKPTVKPLAVIEMDLRAVVNPDAGIISVEAALTPASHLFSEACHITGGFAFYSWISGEHAGDFVVTLGGYHPSFIPPAHYPAPARVGLNWQYDQSVQIKGDLYFAFTPSAVMAGGHLEVTYHKGSIRAWLRAGADFLLMWKPYYYEASMYVDVGGSLDVDFLLFTKTITVDVGASLHLSGPDLSGFATVDLYITSFDVAFGAAPAGPKALEWTAFKESFLPAKSQVSVAIADGLVETVNGVPVVNPQHLRLVTDTCIPVKKLQDGGATGAMQPDGWRRVGVDNAAQPALTPNVDFSVAPMAISASQFDTTHSITITQSGTALVLKDHFQITGVMKQLPRALWDDRSTLGTKLSVSELSKTAMLDRLCCGIELSAKTPRKPVAISKQVTAPASDILPSGHWAPTWTVQQPVTTADARKRIAADVMKAETIKRRSQLMAAFDLDVGALDILSSFEQDFRNAPVFEPMDVVK